MSDIDALVKELRNWVDDEGDGPFSHHRRCELKAASTILALRAERDALQSRVGELIERLEAKSFHPGIAEELAHIYYCNFCHYSRGYVDKHGHGESCVLFRAAIAAST